MKCPRCQHGLIIPVEETVAEKQVTTVAKQEPENLCAGCGKKIKPGVSRCKRCREEAKAKLATRIGHETRLEDAYTKQARFLASDPREGSFPHVLHLIAIVITGGLWFPFYLRSYLRWKA